ncbi:MAG: cytochrome c biogenesis protein CcsA [Burkholderiales bacterium]
MPSILAYGLNAVLYAALGAFLARGLWRANGPTPASYFSWVRLAVLVPLGLQSWLLYRDIFTGAGMSFGVGAALSAIVWMSVLIYWAGSFVYRMESLQALVIPVAAVAALMPAILPSVRPLPNANTPFFRVHLTLSILAYSLFTIASLHALLMAIVEKRLHSGALPPLLRNLPPLLALEKMLFRIIALGFLLLTASLASGMLFSETVFGKPLQFTHKVVFGILSWLVFGALLVGRMRWGWRGRKALRWTMTGFLMLVLAYIGSKFVLEVLLGR